MISRLSNKIFLRTLIAVSLVIFIGGLFTLGVTQTFGWVYSCAFAISAVPQSLKSIKDGHSRGVADGTLILWTLGEIGGLVYGLGLMQWPIIFNCAMNTFWVGIVVYYRLFPRE